MTRLLSKREGQKQLICNAIKQNGKMGFNALKRIVVEDKAICSYRPFKEMLDELVSEGKVMRMPQSNQIVLYFVDRDLYQKEVELLGKYPILFKIIESRFDAMKTPEFLSLPHMEKALYIKRMLAILHSVIFDTIYMGAMTKNTSFEQWSKRADQVRDKVRNLMFKELDDAHIVVGLLSMQYAEDAVSAHHQMEDVIPVFTKDNNHASSTT